MLAKSPKTLITSAAILVVLIALAFAAYLGTKVDVPQFSDYPAGQERKDAFFSYFLPMVQQRNQEILKTRQQVMAWRSKSDDLTRSELNTLDELATRYRMDEFDPSQASDWNSLLTRLDIVPPSLALAQAANESAWGTSRFSREAHNYFGQWCFEKGCGVVPSSRDTGKTHEVASFRSPQASVEAYILNLNRHNAYQTLRQIRKNLRTQDEPITGVALTAGLERYSERGEEYIKELRSMIRFNKLGQYDGMAQVTQ